MDKGDVTDSVAALLLFISSQWSESPMTAVHSGKCLQTQNVCPNRKQTAALKMPRLTQRGKEKLLMFLYFFVFLFEIFCSESGTFILMFQSAVIKVLLNVRICV